MADSKKLTSVKVEEDLFLLFKHECIKSRFSFQKLADRAIFLYLTDKEFRNQIHKQTNISLDISYEEYVSSRSGK